MKINVSFRFLCSENHSNLIFWNLLKRLIFMQNGGWTCFLQKFVEKIFGLHKICKNYNHQIFVTIVTKRDKLCRPISSHCLSMQPFTQHSSNFLCNVEAFSVYYYFSFHCVHCLHHLFIFIAEYTALWYYLSNSIGCIIVER